MLQQDIQIGIVGTGMIGASLAALFTGNGYRVSMYAVNGQEQERCLTRYRDIFSDLVKEGLVTPRQAERCEKKLNIALCYDALSDADLVYECVVERAEIKWAVYRELEQHCKSVRAIASSTSAMPVERLAEGLTVYKDRFLVAHPWNPPHMVPCVEVVPGSETSEEALQFLLDVLRSVGRAPVVLRKSAPGFVANRLQHALYREAVYMVEQGIASPQDIDLSMRTSFIPRYTSIGIFEHFDYAGLDMIESIQESLLESLCSDGRPQELVVNHVRSNDLGAKTGRGVLDWTNVDMDAFRKRAAKPYLHFFDWKLPED